MQLLSSHEGFARMNRLGANRSPFLFVIDYAQKALLVEPLSTLLPDELHYDFRGQQPSRPFPPQPLPSPIVWEVQPPCPKHYEAAFLRVQQGLLRGDSFLCNLTQPLPLHTNLSLEQLYAHSKAPYRLWWKGRFVCFSPECFVRIDEQGRIATFPMKGTRMALTPQAEQDLLSDSKEQAEHATIVDLLRNDLSQVAQQVRVERYRYVERIDTQRGPLLQTSSEVSGQLPPDWNTRIGDILHRLLPAGSITGAPKAMTQQIIAQAEGYERGYYTGVMGIFDGQSLDSAVMIRFVEQSSLGQLCFKAGGGITTQSHWQDEYEETIAKARFPLS